MTKRIPCIACDTMILPSTAKINGGLCAPCKGGFRQRIESSKTFYAEEKRLNETCPYRALWQVIIAKWSQGGMDSLSPAEKRYFAVNELEAEVYRGGLEAYFCNSSVSNYALAVESLKIIEAKQSVRILKQAKCLYFGDIDISKQSEVELWELAEQSHEDFKGSEKLLEELNKKFCTDPDSLEQRLQAFARKTGLVNE